MKLLKNMHVACKARCKDIDSTNTVNALNKSFAKDLRRRMQNEAKRNGMKENGARKWRKKQCTGMRVSDQESGKEMLIEYWSYVTIIQTSIMLSKVCPIDSSFLIATHSNTKELNKKHTGINNNNTTSCRRQTDTCDQLKGKNIFNSISEIDANHTISLRTVDTFLELNSTICAPIENFNYFDSMQIEEFTTMQRSFRLKFSIQSS